jgi:hypothetical protein
VTLSGSTIADGNGGLNYTILAQNGNAISTINKANLTVTAQTDTRGYNGTVSSAVAPVVTGTLYDAVGTAATQVYDTKNVGVGKTLTASGLVVNDGNGGANYAISYVTDNTGVITAAALSVTANNQNKIFGNTFIFTGNEFTPAGLQNGETIGSVTLASAGAPAPAPVGPYAIMASNATGGTFTASDYNISYVNGLMTVNPVTPPVTPQALVDPPLDGLINPVLVGLQSLGIGDPLSEGSLNCMVGDNNLGTSVDDGVAVSVPHRCVPTILD